MIRGIMAEEKRDFIFIFENSFRRCYSGGRVAGISLSCK